MDISAPKRLNEFNSGLKERHTCPPSMQKKWHGNCD